MLILNIIQNFSQVYQDFYPTEKRLKFDVIDPKSPLSFNYQMSKFVHLQHQPPIWSWDMRENVWNIIALIPELVVSFNLCRLHTEWSLS